MRVWSGYLSSPGRPRAVLPPQELVFLGETLAEGGGDTGLIPHDNALVTYLFGESLVAGHSHSVLPWSPDVVRRAQQGQASHPTLKNVESDL